MPVPHFPQHRQTILDTLVQARKQLDPDIVLTPALSDTHQHPRVIADESFRAFKPKAIYGYEMSWSAVQFSTTTFSTLEVRRLDLKVKAIGYYETQQFREYSHPDLIKNLTGVRGG